MREDSDGVPRLMVARPRSGGANVKGDPVSDDRVEKAERAEEPDTEGHVWEKSEKVEKAERAEEPDTEGHVWEKSEKVEEPDVEGHVFDKFDKAEKSEKNE